MLRGDWVSRGVEVGSLSGISVLLSSCINRITGLQVSLAAAPWSRTSAALVLALAARAPRPGSSVLRPRSLKSHPRCARAAAHRSGSWMLPVTCFHHPHCPHPTGWKMTASPRRSRLSVISPDGRTTLVDRKVQVPGGIRQVVTASRGCSYSCSRILSCAFRVADTRDHSVRFLSTDGNTTNLIKGLSC